MAQVELFKKVGKYKDKNGEEKNYINFYAKCGDTYVKYLFIVIDAYTLTNCVWIDKTKALDPLSGFQCISFSCLAKQRYHICTELTFYKYVLV